MMLQQLKGGIDKQIDGLTQKQVELEPSSGEKQAAVESASQDVSKAEEALTAASKDLSDAQDAQKVATNNLSKADEHLYQVWADMKAACDEQDNLADEVKDFQDRVLTSFEKLKEKEPEPEPVEQEQEEEMVAPEESAADMASPEPKVDADVEMSPEAVAA